ncbi:MAG TPA: hypothetical protein VJK05_05125 [archaeon]|nr:hypothetical protein [archaeon]
MIKESLQEIQDFYENKGFKGEKLEMKLKEDKKYQKILLKRQFQANLRKARKKKRNLF